MNTETGHRVLVDSHETRSGIISHLDCKEVNSEVIGNLIADYAIGRECGIERKTAANFLSSIKNLPKKTFKNYFRLFLPRQKKSKIIFGYSGKAGHRY